MYSKSIDDQSQSVPPWSPFRIAQVHQSDAAEPMILCNKPRMAIEKNSPYLLEEPVLVLTTTSPHNSPTKPKKKRRLL